MAYKGDQTFHSPSIHHVTMEVSRLLGGTHRGRATGGSATTLIDIGTLAMSADLTLFPDNHFNDGTIWLIKDSAEAAAAPEEDVRQVSSFTSATGTVTVKNAWASSSSAASGDTYAIATRKYPMYKLIDAVNAAIQDVGPLPYSDISSITTAASQTEYTLPVHTNMDLRRVFIQGRTGDANDNRWQEIQGWGLQHPVITADAADDILVLPFQYPTGRLLRLDFVQVQSPVYEVGDHVHSRIHPNLLAHEAAVHLLEWKDSGPANDPNIGRQLARFTENRGADGLTKIERMRAKHAIYTPLKRSKLLILGRRVPVDEFRINP